MPNKPAVLVIQDTSVQREVMSRSLVDDGYAVSVADTAMNSLKIIQGQSPDVIVLDANLPDMSGADLCHRLKSDPETKSIPIILLSPRYEEVDRLRRLDTGADDYLVRPVSVFDLLTRVRIQMRGLSPVTGGQTLKFDGIVLDFEAHLVYKSGKVISMSATCLRLLATFLEQPGRVWRRADLVERVWGRDIALDERTVDVHIGRLRKAFTREGLKDPLRTIKGKGYMII